jgi:hypothetical protein
MNEQTKKRDKAGEKEMKSEGRANVLHEKEDGISREEKHGKQCNHDDLMCILTGFISSEESPRY